MKIVISSGHGKNVRGASGYLDEVDEARRVVDRVAEYLASAGVGVEVFHDDTSTTQSANLERIVDFHNEQVRDLDVSVHFNAYQTTPNPMGTEVLYVTQQQLAAQLAEDISDVAGFTNRGAKKRTDLAFLNGTDEPAILIETCFVDSERDSDLYHISFEAICAAIAGAISGICIPATEPPAIATPPPEGSTTPPAIDLPAGWSKLLTIEPVTIWQMLAGSYISFISDLDICNDGSGDDHGDVSHQPMTAYWNNGNFLDADVDKYIVIPPQVRELIEQLPAKVMGCQARLTNVATGVWTPAVTGEIGPDDKTGEAAYCAAKVVNPKITHNSGDKSRLYLFELWPNLPATVDGTTYKLE
jgi:N-acetylmuramoyl-L-alanine amidase